MALLAVMEYYRVSEIKGAAFQWIEISAKQTAFLFSAFRG